MTFEDKLECAINQKVKTGQENHKKHVTLMSWHLSHKKKIWDSSYRRVIVVKFS